MSVASRREGAYRDAMTNTTKNHDDWPCSVHGPGDDECVRGPRGGDCMARSRPIVRPNVCPRHGETLEPGKWPKGNGCWECDMEAAEAQRDLEEHNAVYTYKMNRGW